MAGPPNDGFVGVREVAGKRRYAPPSPPPSPSSPAAPRPRASGFPTGVYTGSVLQVSNDLTTTTVVFDWDGSHHSRDMTAVTVHP